MSFYNVFKGICEGVAEAKKDKYRDWQYEQLTTTPFLYDDEELEQLYRGAKNKHEHECILEHLYRFNAREGSELLEIDCYKKLEQKIIDRYWRN